MKSTPIGLDKDTKELKLIDDVVSGLNCNCICPSCSALLVARKGAIRSAYFAHHRVESTLSCAETAIHLMAKHIIKTQQVANLPKLVITSDVLTSILVESLQSERSYFDDITQLEMVTEEYTILNSRIKADIWATFKLLDECNEIAIEVAVTHFVDEEKRDKAEHANLSMVEVDLSELINAEHLTFELIEIELAKNEHWNWVNINSSLYNKLHDIANKECKNQLRQRNELLNSWFKGVRELWLKQKMLTIPAYNYDSRISSPKFIDDDDNEIKIRHGHKQPNIGGEVLIDDISNIEAGYFHISIKYNNGIHFLPVMLKSISGEPSRSPSTYLRIDFSNTIPHNPEFIMKQLTWGYSTKAQEFIRKVNKTIRIQKEDYFKKRNADD